MLDGITEEREKYILRCQELDNDVYKLLGEEGWEFFTKAIREDAQAAIRNQIKVMEDKVKFKEYDLEVERRIFTGMKEHLMTRIVELEIENRKLKGEE